MKNIFLILILIITCNSFSQDKRLIGKWKIRSVNGKGFYYNSEKDSIFFSEEFKDAFKRDSEIIKKLEELTRMTYLNAFYFFDENGNHLQTSDIAKDDYKYAVNDEETNIKISDYENNVFMFEIPYRFENDILYLSIEQKFGITIFELKRN